MPNSTRAHSARHPERQSQRDRKNLSQRGFEAVLDVACRMNAIASICSHVSENLPIGDVDSERMREMVDGAALLAKDGEGAIGVLDRLMSAWLYGASPQGTHLRSPAAMRQEDSSE